jgi:hypothetical protein
MCRREILLGVRGATRGSTEVPSPPGLVSDFDLLPVLTSRRAVFCSHFQSASFGEQEKCPRRTDDEESPTRKTAFLPPVATGSR